QFVQQPVNVLLARGVSTVTRGTFGSTRHCYSSLSVSWFCCLLSRRPRSLPFWKADMFRRRRANRSALPGALSEEVLPAAGPSPSEEDGSAASWGARFSWGRRLGSGGLPPPASTMVEEPLPVGGSVTASILEVREGSGGAEPFSSARLSLRGVDVPSGVPVVLLPSVFAGGSSGPESLSDSVGTEVSTGLFCSSGFVVGTSWISKTSWSVSSPASRGVRPPEMSSCGSRTIAWTP